MMTLTELLSDMMSAYKEYRAGALKREDAAEIANLGGKIIRGEAFRSAYYSLRISDSRVPHNPFFALEGDTGAPLIDGKITSVSLAAPADATAASAPLMASGLSPAIITGLKATPRGTVASVKP